MMSEPKEPVATFVAYDEATAKLYAGATDLDKAVRKFDSHLRKIAKHGGPTINDKPMYDPTQSSASVTPTTIS